MTGKQIFKKTVFTTLLVFLVFGIIYILVWWLVFDKKFYPIEQFANFTIPFTVSRWYDFGLICLWPIIITPLACRDKDGDRIAFATLAIICSFSAIGIFLQYGNFIGAAIFTFIGWTITEIYFFVQEKRNGKQIYNRKEIIAGSFYVNVFTGLGAALVFIFSKGLLIGLFFGFFVTVAQTLLTLIYNLVFKSIVRLSLNNQDKKLITKIE